MFEHRADLPLFDARKPLDELLDRGTAGKVFVEREQRNAPARKDPGSAHSARGPLDGRGIRSSWSCDALLRHVAFGRT